MSRIELSENSGRTYNRDKDCTPISFDKDCLEHIIVNSEEYRELHDCSLLMSVIEEVPLVVVGDNFAVDCMYCSKGESQYVDVIALHFYISIFDTDKTLTLWSYVPKLIIQGNTREYEFKNKTIGFIKLPSVTEVEMEEDAFEGLQIRESFDVLHRRVTVKNTHIPLSVWGFRCCIFDGVTFMTEGMIKDCTMKGHKLGGFNGGYEHGIMVSSSSTRKDIEESLERLTEMLDSASELTGKITTIYLHAVVDSKEAISNTIAAVSNYASKYTISVNCEFEVIYTFLNKDTVYALVGNVGTEYAHFSLGGE